MSRRLKRAFSLVLVLVIAVAALIVATTLLTVSESSATRAAHVVQGERAEGIARAGFERALAYLGPLASASGDFDLALDPDLNVNCSGLPSSSPAPTVTSNRPKFSDGTGVVYQGKRYTRVPYDDGAYLIRFDDDQDDFRNESAWSAQTDNNLGGGSNHCIEGPTSLGGGGGGGGGEGGEGGGGGGGGGGGDPADNPFRDRNGAIWVTVIGIAPGIDPARAVHRSTLRRLHQIGFSSSVDGLVVKGNINVGGSADFSACSPVGRALVDGNVSGSSTDCFCGDSQAELFNSVSHCTTVSGACSSVGCAAGTLHTPSPPTPVVEDWDTSPGKDTYFDWGRPCIFYVDDDPAPTPGATGGTGLWYWESGANRGRDSGGNLTTCSHVQGSPSGFPRPNPAATAANDFGACWTPVLLNIDESTAAVPYFGVELAPDGRSWAPNQTAKTITVGPTDPPLTGELYPAFPAGTVLTKPDWAAACVADYPGQPATHCTTCNGSNVALKPLTSGSSDYWFSVASANEMQAIPAGVYVWDHPLNLNASGGFTAPLPTSDPLVMSEWPLATVVVKGDFNTQKDVFLGSGQEKSANPSLIITGNFNFNGNAQMYLAGSVFTLGDWSWSGTGDGILYGEFHTNANWNVNGNGNFEWRYRSALSSPTIGQGQGTPTTSVSMD